jgi:hypothetical protein
MVTNHSNYLNDSIRNVIRGRNFFDDLKILAFVLNPIREAVLALEGRNVTLGDCFFHLAQLGAAIKKLSRKDNISFYHHCVSKMNTRFNEFDDDKYLVCFFFNPNFRGKYLLFFFKQHYNKHLTNLNTFKKNQGFLNLACIIV